MEKASREMERAPLAKALGNSMAIAITAVSEGHRAVECPELRQQQGVRYVSDYDQGAPTTQVAFMVTDFEGTQVDYWH